MLGLCAPPLEDIQPSLRGRYKEDVRGQSGATTIDQSKPATMKFIRTTVVSLALTASSYGLVTCACYFPYLFLSLFDS